eukprot:GDKI01015137.1.p2 GENE.GDKI01015137.1~~GDKI01015137.1.p2  ORF type:complete len:173 (+),score=72.13 GDKI01015137.1:75-593(+)
MKLGLFFASAAALMAPKAHGLEDFTSLIEASQANGAYIALAESPVQQPELGDGKPGKGLKDVCLPYLEALHEKKYGPEQKPWINLYIDAGGSFWGNVDKTRAFLHKESPEVGKECIECFMGALYCGVENCKLACLWGAYTQSCLDCSVKYCDADLVECSGLRDGKMPKAQAK